MANPVTELIGADGYLNLKKFFKHPLVKQVVNINLNLPISVLRWLPRALNSWIVIKKLLEACFDLISSPSPSMKIQIMGRKIAENLGFESLLWKVKKFFLSFFCSFSDLHKNRISLFLTIFEYLVFTNQISIKTNFFNMFYLISK